MVERHSRYQQHITHQTFWHLAIPLGVADIDQLLLVLIQTTERVKTVYYYSEGLAVTYQQAP